MTAPRTGGERWAREELDRLRTRRFSPVAVAAFLDASRRRSAGVRASRPATVRRSRAWSAAGAATWTLLAAAGVEPFRRRLAAGLTWWSAVALMLDWHLGMLETEDGRPREPGAADALTLGRAWLVPVALDTPSPAVCLLAAGSDVLDGVLARAAGPTRAGRDLEGLVDACFAAAAVAGARRRGWLGAGAGTAELVRLGTGTAYATATWLGRAAPPSRAVLRAARTSTGLRVAGLVAAGTGRRRTADVLVVAGCGLGVVAAARAVLLEPEGGWSGQGRRGVGRDRGGAAA